MPSYDFSRLGSHEFERMCQSLLKEVIGNGTVTFGDGRDGGREATFSGSAPYPSPIETWTGEWIFQAKYHDISRIGPAAARQQVLADLKEELNKIVNKYKRKCDNYILITNTPLSSVSDRGTHDRITSEIVPSFAKEISNIHVWGADELSRFLDKYPNVRQSYLAFISPGDLIAELMNDRLQQVSDLATTIRSFLTTAFRREQYAQLDQAGEVGEERMPLERVFIDLNVKVWQEDEFKGLISDDSSYDTRRIVDRMRRDSTSALSVLLSEALRKVVLIGGPGEGKSTLGQYLAQIHRAALLKRLPELRAPNMAKSVKLARLPFRIILKDYAQWLSETEGNDSLEAYISVRMHESAGRFVSPEAIHTIIQRNPCLVILDGLDEVIEKGMRAKVLDRISEFLERCEHVLEADLQVLATSRPTGYSDQFDPSKFLHLHLTKLDPQKVKNYVQRWSRAKQLDTVKGQRLNKTIDECLSDPQIRLLMNTPLQVTILILIVLAGGTPPRQREALFNEYLEVIYKREKSKAKTIIQTEKQLLFELHAYLAYILQSRADEAQDVGSVLDQAKLIREVKAFLRYKDPFSDTKALDEQVKSIVDESQERLVLLVRLRPGITGFELRSIQEFFAAAHLTDTAKDSGQRYERFDAIARPSAWRNVALFFAGRVGRVYSGEAANILEICKDIDRREPDIYLRRGAWLALEIASDRSFGPNRRLQRSIIEYGLSLIDSDVGPKEVDTINKHLSDLPRDDIEHHVIPVLKNKLSSLARPYLETAMNLYKAFDFSGDLLLDLIDGFLCTNTEQDTIFAIRKSLEFEVAPKWVALRIGKAVSRFGLDLFMSDLADIGLSNASYLHEVLYYANFPTGSLYRLLDETFRKASANPFRTVPLQAMKTNNIALSSPISEHDQSMLTLFLLAFIRATTRDAARPMIIHQIDNTIGANLVNRKHNYENRYSMLKDYFPADFIQELLDSSYSELIPHLSACLWIVRLSILTNIEDLIEPFYEFCQSLGQEHRWVRLLLHRVLSYTNSPLSLLLKASEMQSGSRLDAVRQIIRKMDDPTGQEQIIDALREGLSILREEQRLHLVLFGPWALPNDIREEVRKKYRTLFGLDIEEILSMFRVTTDAPRSKFVLDTDTLLMLFGKLTEMAKESSGSGDLSSLPAATSRLTWVQWPNDQRVMEQCSALVSLLLSVSESSFTSKRAAQLLFLKMYEVGRPLQEAQVAVLRSIDAGDDKDSSAPVFITRARDLSSILAGLWADLTNTTPEVYRRAAMLVAAATDRVASTMTALPEPDPELDTIEMDWHEILHLITDDHKHIKATGIKLLALGNLSVIDFRDDLLAEMQNCLDTVTEEAWMAFLRHVRIDTETEDFTACKRFIETILEQRSKIRQSIRQVALSRYRDLIISSESAMITNERSLGLPVQVEES